MEIKAVKAGRKERNGPILVTEEAAVVGMYGEEKRRI